MWTVLYFNICNQHWWLDGMAIGNNTLSPSSGECMVIYVHTAHYLSARARRKADFHMADGAERGQWFDQSYGRLTVIIASMVIATHFAAHRMIPHHLYHRVRKHFTSMTPTYTNYMCTNIGTLVHLLDGMLQEMSLTGYYLMQQAWTFTNVITRWRQYANGIHLLPSEMQC